MWCAWMGLAVAFLVAEAATQGTVQLTAQYSSSTCDGPPTFVEIEKATSCVVDKCSKAASGSKTSTSCSSKDKYHSIVNGLFGIAPFILREAYDDPSCTTFHSAKALKVEAECVQDTAVGLFIRSQLDSDGSISVQYFTDASCSLGRLHHTDLVPRTTAEKHSCDPKALKWFAGRYEHRALTQMETAIGLTDTNSTDEEPADTNSAADKENDGSGLDITTDSGSDTTTDHTATSKSSDTNPDENETNTSKSSDKGSNNAEATTAPTPTGDPNAAANSTTTPTPTSESPTTTTTTTTPPATTSVPAPTRASPATTSPLTVSKASSAASSSEASSASDATNAPTSTAATTEGTTEDSTTEASASGSSAVPVSTGSSNLTALTLVGVAAVTIALVIVILALIVRRLRAEHKSDHAPAPATERRELSDRYSIQTSPFQSQRRTQRRYTKLVQKPYLELEPSDQPIQQQPSEQQTRDQRAMTNQARGSASVFTKTEMWNDDVILACRIPEDKLQVQERISCGAFGEVYRGQYERRRVVVKMLLPQMRLDVKQVNEFLTEAKRAAAMTHLHIVSLIGVAWNARSDVCVVMEYMDGGDLRSLLSDYEAIRHPVGFDNEKATIALHVCQALAYIHTLSTPMIHRDLQSRNILLNRAMEAKLTDCGISREKFDEKMTASVGTSLWIAPEVLMGNFYDEKADIFSFGVVLSELDTHLLPYSNAMTSPGSSQTEGAVMLQNVVSGSLQVEFSQQGSHTMSELGRACTALDPSERPKAAEIVNILQDVLSEELLECSL